MGKTLVLVGLGIAALGLLIMLGVPFGRLPGDISVRRGNFSFYFPLATSIVLSILLTLLFSLFPEPARAKSRGARAKGQSFGEMPSAYQAEHGRWGWGPRASK